MTARRWISAAASSALLLGTAMVGALPAVAVDSEPVSDDGVTPMYVDDNPSCTDLGFAYGFKPDGNTGGTYPLAGGEVSYSTDGTYVDWTSTVGIDAVIVKGGPNANAYVYDPPDESMGDSGLASPINPNHGRPYELSHLEFCYDYEVVVTKTADTSLTRSWDWDIEKVADATELTLSDGQSYFVEYSVSLDATATDSDHAVSGTISVHNPAPGPATITGVTDVVSGPVAADVDCGVTFPYVLAAGATLECEYSADLPDAAARTNTATATTSGPVGGDSGTAAVDFSMATVTEVDECVDVSDSLAGDLGMVCASDLPKSFTYSLDISEHLVPAGPSAGCGEYTVPNVASFLTGDTSASGLASWSIDVTIPCNVGCTLTQGYWKTHSDRGPAPYDADWGNLGPMEEDTPFFSSGKTWYQVFWTPPAGNAYYNLAHQYMAAKLNVLDGASAPATVTSALSSAQTLFSSVSGTTLTKAQRTQALQLASILDAYNNGLTGPGHCSDDGGGWTS